MKVLDFETFLREVAKGVREKLGDGYRVEEMERDDLNGTVKHSLMVARHDETVRPCINMDVCYQQYRRGADIRTVVDGVIASLKENICVRHAGVFDLADWNSVKGRLRGRLINTDRNRKLLKEVPNRAYLDLSIVYDVQVAEAEGKYYAMQIHREHLLTWGVDESVLYSQFVKNMDAADDVLFQNLNDLLSLYVQAFRGINDAEGKLCRYVLGSKNMVYGAVQVCNRKALREIAEYIKDDFWILPSSIHEVLVFPCQCTKGDAGALAETVKWVNDYGVSPNEILSHHVYRYERETGEVRIAA